MKSETNRINQSPRLYSLALSILMVLSGMAADAHHSYAAFDMSKTETVSVTVSKWDWTNPHAHLYAIVVDQKGNSTDWAFESSSPSLLARSGFTRNTFNAGDRVIITYHPGRGTSGYGAFVSAKYSDGREVTVVRQDAQEKK
jgi:hypothetical protein